MSASVKSYVPQAIKGVNKGTNAGLLDIASRVTATAKELSPEDLGELKGSIMWKSQQEKGGKTRGQDLTERPKDLEYVVGTATEYGLYQEFGTRNMDAQPFLRPAVDIEANGMNATGAMIKAMYNSVKSYLKRESMFK